MVSFDDFLFFIASKYFVFNEIFDTHESLTEIFHLLFSRVIIKSGISESLCPFNFPSPG